MGPEVGHFALLLGLCVATLLAFAPAYGAWRDKAAWMQWATPLATAQCALLTLSAGALFWAFASKDFSVIYVAMNANTKLPLVYRLCAFWGAHEGSLLLWAWILSAWTCAVSLRSDELPVSMRAWVLSILGAVSSGFIGFMVFTSNPFLRFLPNSPMQGRDLNPLLQDPGLISHPPILYMGYVGFAVAFAFAIAALITGKLDKKWAGWVRSWTLVAWAFLGCGVILGSWWAYRELGWGGWWFWDPVENASFLPWLSGTALVHSLLVTEKRDTFKAWTALLAICTFSLSLLGTFLVRSGVLVSVHAFAVDPSRGLFLLFYLGAVIGGSLMLYGTRAQNLSGVGNFDLASREAGLLSGNILLLVSMVTVLLGTVYPLLLQALHLPRVSVGAPYFNQMMMPLGLLTMLVMGVSTQLRWWRDKWQPVLTRWVLPAVGSFLLAWGVLKGLDLAWYPVVMLGLVASFWLLWATVRSMQQHKFRKIIWPMGIAHIGLAVCVLGITMASYYSVERHVRLSPGQRAVVAGYGVTFAWLKEVPGPNYKSAEAGVLVQQQTSKDKWWVFPQRRIYLAQKTPLSKVAIVRGVWRDVYIAMGQPLDGDAWSFRLYYKPMVRWIWFGGFLMVLGALMAWWQKRQRVQHRGRVVAMVQK